MFRLLFALLLVLLGLASADISGSNCLKEGSGCDEDLCKNITCTAYPHAVCVENFCDCSTMFFSNGEQVTCEQDSELNRTVKNTDLNPPPPTCEHHVNCFVDPCQVTTCATYPDAVCVSNYCGGCNALFYVNNNQVDCSSAISDGTDSQDSTNDTVSEGKTCVTGGCGSELCYDQAEGTMFSPCIFRCENTCYQYGTCEVQADGDCGWSTNNADFSACIDACNAPDDESNTDTTSPVPEQATSDACDYNGVVYESGERFSSDDGCNSCECDDGGVRCTEMDCEPLDNTINDNSNYEDETLQLRRQRRVNQHKRLANAQRSAPWRHNRKSQQY